MLQQDPMRLHISPLTPDLLPVIVGPRLRDSVSNTSYHSVQTFPENDYGYIDLPAMEGEKLKKKLNGAILKGKTVKVEEARPKKRSRTEVEDDAEDASSQKKAKKSKESRSNKKERDVVQGHEISPDRKVKRGWTEAKPAKPDKPAKKEKKRKDQTSATPSKYSDKDELLFRTKVPPNREDATAPPKKEKKSKSKKRDDGEQVVHEFEKTTKQPTFLKQDVGLGITSNLEYVEGKGWVGESGDVVEQESERVARRREANKSQPSNRRPSAAASKGPATTAPSAPAADADLATSDSEGNVEVQDDQTSSSGSSAPSSPSDSGTNSPTPTSMTTQEVHPLEALFKKPRQPASDSQDVAKPSLEVSTSFSFLRPNDADLDDDDEEEDDSTLVPLTPFSSQEFRSRGLRSAAPTPDTAHPSRFNSHGSSGLPGDEDLDDDDDDAAASSAAASVNNKKKRPQTRETSSASAGGPSDFETKFWENRAENNRAWKLRRRTVLKEKRQRENKARRPKNW